MKLREALQEAMRQAVEYDGLDVAKIGPQHWYSIARAALAEPVADEPVAYRKRHEDGHWNTIDRAELEQRQSAWVQELWKDAEPLYTRPAAAPAERGEYPPLPVDDLATPSGGREAGPEEERIEASYWRFDARHKGHGQWKQAPMSERDAFKVEMRNALEAEKVRAEMRLVGRVWRPVSDSDRAQRVPLTDEQIQAAFDGVDMRYPRGEETRNAFARAIERAHGIGAKP